MATENASRYTVDGNEYSTGFRGHPGAWHGALKRNGKLFWVCEHEHPNRDSSTSRSRTSAHDCALRALGLVFAPEGSQQHRTAMLMTFLPPIDLQRVRDDANLGW